VDTNLKRQEITDAADLATLKQQLEWTRSEVNHRARSVSVGTCFGGLVEISMRHFGGELVFAVLRPIEVVELMHQIAASIDCVIEIKPRCGFASWRGWGPEEQGLVPPGKLASEQTVLAKFKKLKETQNEQTVATKKSVKRRNTK
jgi:hypothetical protein